MSEFLHVALDFPTVVFSFLLIVVVGYWVVVITGLFDLDGADAPWLGFGGVPAGVTLSLLIATAWLLSLIGSQFATGPLLWAVPAVALAGGWLGTRALISPLRGLLAKEILPSRGDFVGRMCVIRTGRVERTTSARPRSPPPTAPPPSSRSGQTGQDAWSRGDNALIFEYDSDGEFFWVMPRLTKVRALMDVISTGFGVLLAVVLVVVIGLLVVISRLFRKVEQGKALIISKVNKVDVTFTGAIVLPVLHKAEIMDISVKTIEIERTGHEGLICRDNIRADIRITFFVRVNKTVEDVIKVAQAIGTARASDQETLQELFNAKFSEALKTVGKQLDFVDLYTKRDEFRDQIIQVIGTDLNGYSLEDAAIDFLEQTPLTQLDPANILDAQGIRKITELTAIEHVRTNEFQRTEEKEITRQNVDAREAILELERRQADAEIKQKREIETVRAREEAEIAQRAGRGAAAGPGAPTSRTDEQLGVQRENQAREVAVAAEEPRAGHRRSRPSGSRRTACWRSSPASGRPSCPASPRTRRSRPRSGRSPRSSASGSRWTRRSPSRRRPSSGCAWSRRPSAPARR